MADIPGTNVAAPLAPFTTDDPYPTHIDSYGQGGWRSVLAYADLAAIPADRRKVGMSVWVENDQKAYVLLADGSWTSDLTGLNDTRYLGTRYAWALLDGSSRVAIGVLVDGSLEVNGVAIGADFLGLQALSATLQLMVSREVGQAGSLFASAGYAWALLDQGNRMAIGVRDDGRVEIGGQLMNPLADLVPQIASLTAIVARELGADHRYDNSGWAYALIDGADRVAFGIRPDGTVVAPSLVLPVPDMSGPPYTSSTRLVGWGDSLTAASTGYLAQIAAMITGRTIVNRGIGGQTSTQIAARQGGIITYLTVQDNQLPASGAVTVTARSIGLLTDQGAQSIDGTLAGVPGILQRASDDSYTFSRLQPGAVVACPARTPFLPAQAVDQESTTLVWLGRNNLGDPVTIQRDTAAIVRTLSPFKPRFLVLGPTNGQNEPSGSFGHTKALEVNNAFSALYGDRYVNVRAALVAAYDPGLPDDVTAHSEDRPPPSLMSDTIHFNNAGYAVVAREVAAVINAKGW